MIGFFHEHVRPDRNDYVNINENNIKVGSLDNFERDDVNIDSMGVPYDYASVMHYGPKVIMISLISRQIVGPSKQILGFGFPKQRTPPPPPQQTRDIEPILV